MIGHRKKQPPVQRTPHIERQKQPAFQYSSNRSQSDKSVRERNEPQKTPLFARLLRRSAYVFTGVAFLVAAVYLSLLSADPKVVITNGQQPLHGSYEEASAEIAGKGLQSHSKLTINRKKIARQLQSRYPEMTAVDVATPLFSGGAVINVELSSPVIVLASGTSSYLLDNRGVVLLDTSTSQTAVDNGSLIQISDQTATPVEIGKPALTSAQVGFATEVKRQSEAKDLPIESIILSAGGGELHVKHSGLPYIVKYNAYEDARRSFGTFVAAREHLDKTRVKPAEYIDVRIAERAYVK